MKRAVVFLLLTFLTASAWTQRVSVENARFMANGREIWFNAVNTPWNHWNDFGGDFDPEFWDTEFGRIRQYGGNATRIWINCNGDGAILIGKNGMIAGATEEHWKDLDILFGLAEKHRIYILATLLSFDHTKDGNRDYEAWRRMYRSRKGVSSFIGNYVKPFIGRYGENPYLFAIEPCNEIEWVHEQHGISWERLQYFCARIASTVHEHSKVLVTVGNSVKWQSEKAEGNLFSDAELREQYDSELAFLDFYSPHWYDWVVKWFGSPFGDRTDKSYELDDKPAVIGEAPANGEWVIYEKAFENGWEGVFAWTSNHADRNGGLAGRLGDEMKGFARKHPELVGPGAE